MAIDDADHWDAGPRQPESSPIVPATPSPPIKVPSVVPPSYATVSQPSSRAPSPGLHVLALIKALRFCWRRAFAVAVPCALLAAVIAWRLLPSASFTAQALLHVASQPPKVIFPVDQWEDFASYQRTQVQMIKTRFVLDAALQEPKVAELRMIQTRRYPRDWLQKQLEVDFSIGPEILRIALKGEDPQELAVIVNAVVDAYLQQYVHLEDNKRRERLQRLTKYQEEWEADLQRRQAELKKQAGETKDPSVAVMTQHFAVERLGAAQKELLQYQTDLRRVEAELELERANAKELSAINVQESIIQEEMERDPELAKLNAREAEIRGIMTGPAAARELAAIQKRRKARQDELLPRIIQREREKILRAHRDKTAQLQSQADSFRKMEELLHRRVEALTKEIELIPREVRDLEPLRDKIARAETVTKKIADEAEALKMALAPPRVQRLEAAEPPRSNEGRGGLYKPLLAGFGTLGLVVFAFSWWEVRAGKIATAADVSSGMGLRIVGALPVSASRSKHRSRRSKVGAYQDELLTASVDATCTVLLHLANQEMVRVLMVTSAVLGEGKTTLASHLAVSLARAGRKTLLLDGDLRRPGLARLFNVPSQPGLREFLRGEVEIDQMIHPTQLPRLSLITTAPWDGSTLEALAQERLPVLFEILKGEYDFTIVDSAPVLGVADSLLIARHVNAVLFSVLRGVSRIPAVCAAQERLAMLGVRTLGAVVNGMDFEGYYGGYRYAGERQD